MRPLSSPVYEHRLLGRAETVIGLIFVIIASTLNPIDAVVGLFIVGPVLTALLYYAVFRRVARTPSRIPRRRRRPSARTPPRSPGGSAGRSRLQVLVFLVFTVTAQAPGLLGGIALGVGVALILTARWLEGWENANEVGLLRESGPRRRTADGGVTGGYYVAGGT